MTDSLAVVTNAPCVYIRTCMDGPSPMRSVGPLDILGLRCLAHGSLAHPPQQGYRSLYGLLRGYPHPLL